MDSLRRSVTMTGLALGLALLAACGAGATATLQPLATAAPTAVPRPATALAGRTPSAPATAVATARVATAATTRTVPAGVVTPPQAAATLQRLGNSRQSWVLGGFAIAGLAGDLRPVFDEHGDDRRVTLTVSGTTLAAYRVGGVLHVGVPFIGVVRAADGDPLAVPALALFAVPPALLAVLVPPDVPYTAVGDERIDGRAATRYTADVVLPDLGIVDPALAGQGGTAATTAWVDDAQGYLVALDATIAAATATTTATARLRVTAVGQTPALVVPR